MNKLIFATNNPGKLKEIRELLGSKFNILSLAQAGIKTEIPEDHDTFEDNALQKARFIFERTQIPVFADDSGLEVEALNGKPGVFSARYAGENCTPQDNINKLLSELKTAENRSARFVTVIAHINKNGEHQFFKGSCNGEITRDQHGKGGFGYDPVFKPAGFDQTFAQMPAETKNSISHRGKTVEKLVVFLVSEE